MDAEEVIVEDWNAKAVDWIREELSKERGIAVSMSTLIDRCERACPHMDWKRLRSLDYGDLSGMIEWIQRPFRDEPPTAPLKGLWFGLHNPGTLEGATADIYVSGSKRFVPDPNDNSWAERGEWYPELRAAHSTILADIYRIGYREGGLGNDAEYPLCLGYGAFAVKQVLNSVAPSLILGESQSLGVAVGFDCGGDFVLVGQFGPGGIAAFD